MSLLGPVGPEIGCDECFDRLDEYVGRATPFPAWGRTSKDARRVGRNTKAWSRS